MKRYLIFVSLLILAVFAWNIAYFYQGYYWDFNPNQPVTTFTKTSDNTILLQHSQNPTTSYEPFEIRGVDLGVGLPGEWATDFAIDQATYLRWFEMIQAMGANTIRCYTILHDDFYNAFYTYNQNRSTPLYLLHGLWVKDYKLNSHEDGFSTGFRDVLLHDSRVLVDVIHGNKSISSGGEYGSGQYRNDISPWVLGYIIGVEWEPSVVVYTNQIREDQNQYEGEYLYTTPEASPFEALLCEVGDKLLKYESQRYKQQRLLAFSNWPTTDPFVYPPLVAMHRDKMATLNVEHIKTTEKVLSGQFASYHVYPYFPDYFGILLEGDNFSDAELAERLEVMHYRNTEARLSKIEAPRALDYVVAEDYTDSEGNINTYLGYLRLLNRYHTMPVVISEYGVTTGRGRAQVDRHTNRNQGFMTEVEQGQALIACYEDIQASGSAGSCVFTWQDEWFKRTWNTMYAVDLEKTPYWSDTQTNEQYFGLLSFDPGETESICYVDGNSEEWTEEDFIQRKGGSSISQKQDEKYLYLFIEKEKWDPETQTLLLPLDITPQSGSTYDAEAKVSFERACDFLILIDGRENSRILVHERYDTVRAVFGLEYYDRDFYSDPPAKDAPIFLEKRLPLTLQGTIPNQERNQPSGETFHTGHLTYGNGNPTAEDYNSLVDYCFSEHGVELRLPWQLLNFSNPAESQIHHDYYDHYGIENLKINQIYIGASLEEKVKERIRMVVLPLQPWHKKVTYHERLKESYFLLRDYWLQHPLQTR